MTTRFRPIAFALILCGACQGTDPAAPSPAAPVVPSEPQPTPPVNVQHVRGPVAALDSSNSQYTRLFVQAAPSTVPGTYSGRIWLLVDSRTCILANQSCGRLTRAATLGAVVRATILTGIAVSDPAAALADTLVIESSSAP